MRFRIFGGLAIVVAMLAVVAAPALAVVAETGAGPVGYLPLSGTAAPHGGAALKATVPSGEPPLLYHGGPVMHSHAAYAIFWAASGHTFPSGYKEAIVEYLKDVAADSGKPSNVYSVSAQYADKTGHAAYSDSFGGSMEDTTAYPTGGCKPYEGFTGVEYTACITDEELESEVLSDVAAKGWPKGLGSAYYVVLPPKVGSCFEGNEGCFDETFCAYHSYTLTSPKAIYANISYSPGDPFGCGVGEYPNGFGTKGNVDDTLSSLSHEANESITDPTFEGYYDEAGFENGDECRNTADDYGLPLGGSEEEETLFNQEIGIGHYYIQQEWSNDINDCAQRVKPPTAGISNPGTVTVGQSASFSAGASIKGDGGISSYEWDFGDGGSGTGPSPSHTFATPGTFTVELTVEDDGGFASSIEREVTVTMPHPSPTVAEVAPSKGTAAGGTVVTIKGTNLADALEVKFGSTAASFEVQSATEVNAISPAHAAGVVDITVRTEGGTSATGPGDRFTFEALSSSPSPSSSTPASNPVAPAPKKNLACRRGFRKKKVKGKVRCVKVQRHHRRKHGRGH